jgi:polycomb protein EED
MFMRFGLFPGTTEDSRGPVLAMCNTASKVFFWDLARLEEYWDHISTLPPTTATETGAKVSTPSSSNPSAAQAADGATKRPRFLIPWKPRVRGGGRLGIPTHRIRDSSPTESDRSTPTTHSHPLATSLTAHHPIHAHPLPPPAPVKATEYLEKSKEVWNKRYGIDSAERELLPHKEEVVRGLSFVGRQVAWSRGGKWCVVVGSAGVIAVFERWERGW